MADTQQQNSEPVAVTIKIKAPAEVAFSVLTRVPMLWWQLPAGPDLLMERAQDRDIILEPRIGGRLYENGTPNMVDGSGIQFATVVTLIKPDVFVLEGTLGLGALGLPFSSVAFRFQPNNEESILTIVHNGTENLSQERRWSLTVLWSDFAQRLRGFAEISMAPLNTDSTLGNASKSGLDDELNAEEIELERIHQQLQTELFQVRQAVAESIAAEKQLENQVQKNSNYAATWVKRAQMAQDQGNGELEKQAMQRAKQYRDVKGTLQAELTSQKTAVSALRDRLSQLESDVQRAYIKKQVLVARSRAVHATEKANEIIARVSTSEAMLIIEEMERKVMERESRAAAASELNPETD